MQHSLRWRDLFGGMVAIAGVIALSIAILVFGNVNSLHGSTLRLFAAVGDARGVLPGTEVWVDGKKVGLVNDVRFRPVTTDSSSRLLIIMEVLDDYRDAIRVDSHVQIRSSGSLLGAPVVYVSAGTPQGRSIQSGDTIRSLPQNDFETVTARFAVASREFPAIIANLKLVAQQLRSAQGTLGALGIERGGPELDQAQARLDRLAPQLGTPMGTVGRALNSRPPLTERARRAMARADSLRAFLATGQSAAGRFRRDSTLLREVRSIRDELNVVHALMSSPQGNVGRFAADSAILDAVTASRLEVNRLYADVRHNPLRYINF